MSMYYNRAMATNSLDMMVLDAINSGRSTVDVRLLCKIYDDNDNSEDRDYNISFIATFDVPLTFICSICSPWVDFAVQSRSIPHNDCINMTINQSKLWVWHNNEYYDDKSRSEYGIIIAERFEEAVVTLRHMNKSYTTLCNFATLRYGLESDALGYMPKIENTNDYEKMLKRVEELRSEFGPYMWLKTDEKKEDSHKEIWAVNIDGNSINIPINLDGSFESYTDKTKLWMYVLYPMINTNQTGFVIANDVDQAWEIISKYDLYQKAGGEWIGIENTEYVSPAHYMVLINLGTKQKFGNFGDKFVPIHEVYETGKPIDSSNADNDLLTIPEDDVSLWRWVIRYGEDEEIRFGVAIYKTDDSDGLTELLKYKFQPKGLKVEYNVKDIIRLPGFQKGDMDSMIYDIGGFTRKIEFDFGK